MDDRIALLLTLIPCFALAGAVLTALLGPRVLREKSHLVVIGALLCAFICSYLLFAEVRAAHRSLVENQNAAPDAAIGGEFERTVTLWTWADVGEAYDPAANPALAAGASTSGQPVNFRVDITLRADALTSVMLLMVTLVSTLVAFFAAGYMRGDPGYWRFFAYFGLFVFSMTMLVSVSNFVLLFVFWEAVGLCSYLLIGFWYQKPEAAAAGKKAFLVNRVGDFGFTLALFLIWTTYGSLNFHDPPSAPQEMVGVTAVDRSLAPSDAQPPAGVLGPRRIAAGGYVGGTVGFAICLLLLVGACGKSAQFPLHVWLPDAMEGPTPVSALIHAATMVTAGIYMIVRCSPLFMVSPPAQLLVASVGGVTALLAALIALTQHDLKRVLAYSTVSQLGYMFMALGVGTFAGITAGMFHLFTHAFFKALLFLGAGSVMHAMGHVIDMRRFGGLRKRMPITHITFFIGCLALAGFPGLSGFWSKDAIVAALHEKGHSGHHAVDEDHGQVPRPAEGHDTPPAHDTSAQAHGNPAQGQAESRAATATPVPHSFADTVHTDAVHTDTAHTGEGENRFAAAYQALYVVALLTAFLTAFYTFRALYMTFYGAEHVPYEAAHHGDESPAIMYVPLLVLAAGAAFIGIFLDQTWRGQGHHLFAEFLGSTPSLAAGDVAATRQPFVFHAEVAATSGAIALGGILVATYFYLGGQREIQWLRSLLDFDSFRGLSWLQPYLSGGSFHARAQRRRLGWASALLANSVSFVLLVLAAPFSLGNFVSPYKLSYRKFFLDELYHFAIVLPLRTLAAICYGVDRFLVDGLVNTVGKIPPAAGASLKTLQVGLLPFYTLAMVLGTLILVAARILWAGS